MENHVIICSILFITGIVIGIVVTKAFLTKPCFFYQDDVKLGASKIEPREASHLINSYAGLPEERKLKVTTPTGEEQNINSFIIEAKVLYDLSVLAGHSFYGIALNLALNAQGSTLVVSALVRDSTRISHLIPAPGQTGRSQYFYDHLNICPDMCPLNHVEMTTMT